MTDTDTKLDQLTAEMRQLNDGYANVVTKLGTAADKSLGTFFLADRYLGWSELSTMYEQDAVSARIVRRVVDDSTRTNYMLSGTDQTVDWKSVQSELDDLDALNQIGDAWRWARLYGGALVVMAINDGKPFSEPVDWPNVTKLSALSVMDSTNVIPVGFVPGLGSRAFAEPQQYEIVVPWSGKNSEQRIIHRSRVIRFDGLSVPASRMVINGGWGPGVLQQVWRQIKRLGSAEGYAENLLHELSLMIFKITGFREMLCGGPGSEETVKQLLEQLKWSMDNLHVLGLDSEDDFQEIKRGVEGVEKLLDKFTDALVRATDMPRLILTGEQPGGLNADAKGEVRAWYDHVASQQQTVLSPALNRILEVVFAARRHRGETVPEEWTIEYESLTQQAPETFAETLLKLAQSTQILVGTGVITPAQARQMLTERGMLGSGQADPAEPTSTETERVTEPAVEAQEQEQLQTDDPISAPVPSTDEVPPDLMSPREAAERFALPTRSITLLIDRGALRYWQVGSHRQVSMADIAALARREAAGE